MELYGLIGYPLGHSFSRKYFTERFQSEGIDAEYHNFEIPEATMLIDVIKNNPNLRGLNCTLPHKQAILPLMDELSPEAKRIGAVNVIKIRDGKLKGYNSDIIGFKDSISPLLRSYHQKALILGTGGASKAVCAALEDLGLSWTYVSRKKSNNVLTYDEITPEVMQNYKVIVNCSPVGMFPKVDQAPDLPYHLIDSQHLLYDLVYNPVVTRFMQLGEERGATVKSGLEMLRLQAEASWMFWNEV